MSTRAVQIEVLLGGLIHPTTYLPLTGGSVYFYSAGTTTAKNVWTEKEKTNAYTSFAFTSGGIKQLYGDGVYKLLIYDSSDTLIYTWDNIKIRAHNYSVVSKAASYTATTDDDVILVNTTSGHVTITFPSAATMAYPIIVKHILGSNNVILDPNSTELIDGAATYTFSSTGAAIIVFSSGAALYKANDTALAIVDGTDIVADSITLNNTGLHILDSNATHDLIIKPGSNLTADKTLTVTTGDADRTFTLGGNLSITGNFTVSDATTLKAADIFPATTVMAFGQNAAPTGWTRLTTGDTIYDAATDNAIICFAKTGNVAQGGAVNPQTAHTHEFTEVPNHVHVITALGNSSSNTHSYLQSGNTQFAGGGLFDTANPTGGVASATTVANSAPYYIEMMLAKKD